MQRSFYIALLALSAFVFSSCQKSSDVVGGTQDLQGTWTVTGITSDRAYDFNGDGYGKMRQGCNAPWQNITWQLSNRNLSIRLPNDDLNLSLQQFDKNTLRGVDQVTFNGNDFNITYTFQRR